MKCQKCEKDFLESQIELSHDIPCYLFYEERTRRKKKQRADKFSRHHLCNECHKKYEKSLNYSLKILAIKFSKEWFNGSVSKI